MNKRENSRRHLPLQMFGIFFVMAFFTFPSIIASFKSCWFSAGKRFVVHASDSIGQDQQASLIAPITDNPRREEFHADGDITFLLYT